jgi:molybdopterin/thiamine biosynthesis adenylyltransferase
MSNNNFVLHIIYEESMFSYEELITRNIGFVSEKEQLTLKNSTIFIAGVGGMGGAALACLARTGIENFIIADFDSFDMSNLNRQIFANLDTVNQGKVEATVEALKKINPNMNIETYGAEWTEHLDKILNSVDIVINGCDDTFATITLMRAAQENNKIVIDAFASPLPNIYTVRPKDPRPEKIFNYPSVGKCLTKITKEDLSECTAKEAEYVAIHSSSPKHLILEIAAEIISGKRKRISLAPMVWMTGCLMSYEVLKVLLGKKSQSTYRGIFINPWEYKIEKPLNPILALIKGYFVRRLLKRLTS